MHKFLSRPAPRIAATLLAVVVLFVTPGVASAEDPSSVSAIERIMHRSMATYHLKAIIVRVRSNGRNLYTGAFGDSMTGVPATPDMHFRNGAMAFTYMATMLLAFVDQKKLSLNDKVAKFFPDLPHANEISLKNLANMTSGYADYVYEPEVLDGTLLQPFRRWTPQELIHIGVSKPMMFVPGTNFGYSHTNYVILGLILQRVAGMPLDEAMKKYIFGPMHLSQTQGFTTPQIPEPVLHTYSSERREALHIPASVPFYEESTFWNPSWTTVEGAVQITDIADMAASMEAVGNGALLSKGSLKAQIGPNLVGFGHAEPKCRVCRKLTAAFNYGLGVINAGPWVLQSKLFAGSDATAGSLPAKRIAVAVEVTYLPAAFDDKGNFNIASPKIFEALANAVAPGTSLKLP